MKENTKRNIENDLLKYEIAEELGLTDKINQTGWKSLTAKESGRIGGLMTKRKREKENNPNQDQ
ncbi:MAG: small acid-soluble spore protein alpha/beta type [Firmicutes bacterium HGW-Firmicutes-7]|nr:MAG: small acid-soluble spore protein alpha/beta type [Firmicutes bacterium HGW-Firmicutes-7]